MPKHAIFWQIIQEQEGSHSTNFPRRSPPFPGSPETHQRAAPEGDPSLSFLWSFTGVPLTGQSAHTARGSNPAVEAFAK